MPGVLTEEHYSAVSMNGAMCPSLEALVVLGDLCWTDSVVEMKIVLLFSLALMRTSQHLVFLMVALSLHSPQAER